MGRAPIETMTVAAAIPASMTILPEPPPPPTAIGLIAGGGQLPVLIAKSLIRAGHPVYGLGLAKQYDPSLPGLCLNFKEVGLLKIGTWGRILSGMGVRHAIMVGKVDKAQLMHDPFRIVRYIPDWRMLVTWYKHLRHDRRSHAVLSAIANELDRCGVALLDSTAPIPDDMADSGVMTRLQPTREQRGDIEFVWPILHQMLSLDVGQAVAVRERDVLAVEAVEGTDRMIERVGKLCRAKGWTLCKGARAGHDRRSDVPTVGLGTIEILGRNGGGCLALAAGEVIMLDKQEMLKRAEELGITIVGVPAGMIG